MATPAAAFKILMNGVISWDLPREPVPSELLLIGEAAFPVMVNDKGQVLIAASFYGKGRLVVVAHEGYLSHAGLSPFLLNAVGWLRPSPEAPVVVHANLASLVSILQDAGVEAQVQPESGESLGVYCITADNDTLPEKLVPFVKRGGGLLIGGQAGDWATQHSHDKVLFQFPGNQVTSVAGVYFTNVSGDRDQFNVSEEVPEIPLYIRCEEELAHAQQQLLEGISTMDIETKSVSSLLVHGQLAFPLGTDNSSNSFLAAAHYGRGRVVLGGHKSLILSQKMVPFVLNALRWLAGNQTGKIGVVSSMKELGSMLSENGLEWCRTELLTSDLSVFCCSSLHDMEVKNVEEFVAEGGGLLIGAKEWKKDIKVSKYGFLTSCPTNKILQSFGLTITTQTGNRGSFPVSKPGVLNYHIRRVLSQLAPMLHKKAHFKQSWLEKLVNDCSYMFRIQPQESPIYGSVKKHVLEVIKQKGFPIVTSKNRVTKGSAQALLLFLGHELVKAGVDSSQLLQKPSFLPPTKFPITIEISRANRNSWVSTGLYLPEGQIAHITLPDEATGAGLKVLIGCHTDNISPAKIYSRPPVMARWHKLKSTENSLSWLHGGLLYIIVPHGYKQAAVPITIGGAVSAPYFRLGRTTQEEWDHLIKESKAPWGELATDSIILTVPTSKLRTLENPKSLLQLWDNMMEAVAKLAAQPFPFRRPERIVVDVQISGSGFLHSGYPIMGNIRLASGLLEESGIKKSGIWGALHEMGHNQQKPGWDIRPHTTEALCNLWPVYVSELVLSIPRVRAHPQLQHEKRQKRIHHYLKKKDLSKWEEWTALETYLQLQEAFGWEPFIQLFAAYQTLSGLPRDNTGKMNLWVKKFSEAAQRNLVPFFEAWGWPVQEKVAKSLASLPEWQENPMKLYTSNEKE